MTPRRPDRSPAVPRLLPINAPTPLADLLDEIRATVLRGRPAVAFRCDVDPLLAVSADLHAALTVLVEAAVTAALERGRASDFPVVREVVVTAVDTDAAVEIEVADSGPDDAGARLRPEHHAAATRLGGTLVGAACAEGGTAVTLRIPRRPARSMAA